MDKNLQGYSGRLYVTEEFTDGIKGTVDNKQPVMGQPFMLTCHCALQWESSLMNQLGTR